jgi:hypothetical protein
VDQKGDLIAGLEWRKVSYEEFGGKGKDPEDFLAGAAFKREFIWF